MANDDDGDATNAFGDDDSDEASYIVVIVFVSGEDGKVVDGTGGVFSLSGGEAFVVRGGTMLS